jgi:DNA-binding LacI/PurR family transcriptional regulator
MPTEPKHRSISRELLAEIAAGRFAPSGRLPSEAQLVRRFAVSRPTVGRALRELQDQGLIERRVGSGTFVRPATPGPASGRREFGLMIPGLGTTEVFEAICGELAGLARVHEYGLLWGSGTRPGADQGSSVHEVEQWCEQFIKREVSGVFFAPFEGVPHQAEVNQRLAERLRKTGIAVVLLDRDLGQFPTRSEYDLCGVDNFAGGYALAEHLVKLGCRRPAFVMRPLSPSTASGRVAGVREAMLDQGLAISPRLVRTGQPDDPAFVEELTADGQIDAAICVNDQTAALLMRSLERVGVRVPRDVRVVGFDDLRFAALLSVPLTTIHHPVREIAVAAFRAMMDRIADPTLPPRCVTLSARLVIRESCGAYMDTGSNDQERG